MSHWKGSGELVDNMISFVVVQRKVVGLNLVVHLTKIWLVAASHTSRGCVGLSHQILCRIDY